MKKLKTYMFRHNYLMAIICLGLVINSCIKPFEPEINSNEINKYVIHGQVTNNEGYQEVCISLSSPVGSPTFIPVKSCTVTISDDKGNSYTCDEYQPGYYHVWMTQSSLNPGTSYKVDITTKQGIQISSAYDKMPDVPEIDSIYFVRKDIPTSDPNRPRQGIQFYIDYDGTSTNSPFVKWDLIETWEYHTAYPIEYYYDGTYHQVIPPDYSKNVCWRTQVVDEVFTLSTQNLSENKYAMFPLHFVDNKTARLGYGYSLLIKQLSLSEAAYTYWDQIRINHSNANGLYQQQPLAIRGNLQNKTNSVNEVLGYFNASSITSKRIFIQNIPNLEMDFTNFCSGPQVMRLGWADGASPTNPIYLYLDKGIFRVLDNNCVDCILIGGTNVKPDFWPN